jgi:type II secretory pathway component GspD/PulD (secretin)
MAAFSAAITPSSAQSDTAQKPIEINLQGAPVKQALSYLFTQAKLNYTLDPNVGGTVTVNLRGVSFETALKAVLKSANPPLVADRDTDTGVYYVRPKVETIGPTGLPPGTTTGPGSFSPGGPTTMPGNPGMNRSPAPTPASTGFTASGTSGISLSQFESIQLRYADATILIGLLGQPSLIVPATSMKADALGGTGGGGASGPSISTPTTSTTGQAGNTSFGGR